METKLRAFRKRAREENRGRTGRSLRYSRELRLKAVRYLKRRKGAGCTLEGAASELGVSCWSLSRWVEESEKRGAVVPVEVTESEESTASTVVTPRGHRIEGLSEDSLVRLVERLG
jgi:transposase-like protein